jgi:hypothetical protein
MGGLFIEGVKREGFRLSRLELAATLPMVSASRRLGAQDFWCVTPVSCRTAIKAQPATVTDGRM